HQRGVRCREDRGNDYRRRCWSSEGVGAPRALRAAWTDRARGAPWRPIYRRQSRAARRQLERRNPLDGRYGTQRDSMIRVMLVDDHAVVRTGFRLLLQAQTEVVVVAEAESGEVA